LPFWQAVFGPSWTQIIRLISAEFPAFSDIRRPSRNLLRRFDFSFELAVHGVTSAAIGTLVAFLVSITSATAKS
jgi:hypothetical protein